MDLQQLLSVNMATLAALGTLLLAMGQRSPWAALAVWMAAVISLAVTDFTGWFRLGRNAASLLGMVILCVFLPGCLRAQGEGRLIALANMLIFVQVIFLFQEKDERVCWWLSVMSLLQVIVAARFAQGAWFGVVLVIYMLVGMVGMTLIFMYGEWRRHGGGAGTVPVFGGRERDCPPGESQGDGRLAICPTSRRWPLAAGKPEFTSSPAGNSRTGMGGELLYRLGMLGLGTLSLALVFFFTVPRFGHPAWHGASDLSPRTVIGFNDHITLGKMGEVLESREEVMRLDLIDSVTQQPYPLTDQVYLRGAVVTHYQDNQWERPPRQMTVKPAGEETPYYRRGQPRLPPSPTRPVVIERITVEPFSERNELFYIWPLRMPVSDTSVRYDWMGECLMRDPQAGIDREQTQLSFRVSTRALSNGIQTALIPVETPPETRPLLEMPALPRLTALARKWIQESKLKPQQQMEIARRLEWQLANGGKFTYSLQGQDRDLAIDNIEDFVSNHPQGHCEYFATALALMLRSEGIPSRVVLGYRCDEYNDVGKFFQVRQLHAHAWTEALVKIDHPERPSSETQYGWLRLDATPAASIGSTADENTFLGRWQGRFHRLQAVWDNYIVEMDRRRQHETVYQPVGRAVQAFKKLRDSQWWRNLGRGILGFIGRIFTAPGEGGHGGILAWIWAIGVGLVTLALLAAMGWGLWRLGRRILRWLLGRRNGDAADGRVQVEFYRRLEHLLAARGLVRRRGQTPREFARVAGPRLAAETGRGDLAELPSAIVEAFYQVRFGGEPLDNSRVQTVEHALEELRSARE